MTESKFNELIDQIFFSLEMALDEVDAEVDYENSGSVLTVIFENETRLVFSRQPPTRQLWLAARSGGFHFAFDEEAGDWRDTRAGHLFRPFVVEQMLAQGDVRFAWL
jgi:CyaY protein